MKIKKLLAIFLLLILCSCNDGPEVCLDPDDFGFPKISVDSAGTNVAGFYEQISAWTETPFVTNDQQIVMYVKPPEFEGENAPAIQTIGRWYPWYEINQYYFSVDPCLYLNGEQTDGGDITINKTIINPACYLERGAGLYALFTDPQTGFSPNQSRSAMNDPTKIGAKTIHMGKDTNQNFGYRSTEFATATTDSGLTDEEFQQQIEEEYGWADMSPAERRDIEEAAVKDTRLKTGGYIGAAPFGKGSNLFFKIADRYYDDNKGSYTVIIKSGFKTKKEGIIEKSYNAVRDRLDEYAEKIFINLVASADFVRYIQVLLMIFISIKSIQFVIGMVETKPKDVFVLILKCSIVIALIDPDGGWDFFYNYFFKVFIYGVDEIACAFATNILASPTGCGVAFFDQFLNVIFSVELRAKIQALFYGNRVDQFFALLIYMLALIYILYIFLIAIFKVVVLFMIIMLVTALLIIISPIFISFLLFEYTASFFQQWLKLIISFAMQALFAYITMMFFISLVMHQLYLSFGFGVCNRLIADNLFGTFYAWRPAGIHWTASGNGIDLLKDKILIPEGYADNDGNYFPAYSHEEERYVDFPYLRTSDTTNNSGINAMMDDTKLDNYKTGFYADINSIFVFFVLSLLFLSFYNILYAVGRGLGGTAFLRASMQDSVNNFTNGLKSMAAGAYNYAPIPRGLRRELNKVRDKVSVDKNLNAYYEAKARGKQSLSRGLGKITGTSKLLETREIGKQRRQIAMGKVGGAFSTAIGAGGAAKDHAVSLFTGGLLGKNWNDKVKATDPLTGRTYKTNRTIKQGLPLVGNNDEIQENLNDKSVTYYGSMFKAAGAISVFSLPIGVAFAGVTMGIPKLVQTIRNPKQTLSKTRATVSNYGGQAKNLGSKAWGGIKNKFK